MYREFVVTEAKRRHKRIAENGGDPGVLDVSPEPSVFRAPARTSIADGHAGHYIKCLGKLFRLRLRGPACATPPRTVHPVPDARLPRRSRSPSSPPLPSPAVGVNDAISALQQNGQYAADASHDDVMSAYTSIDKPGRLFLTNSGSSTSKRVPKGVVALPWKISASFTLNGPDVSVSDVSGASGMIGIRIALHATKPDVTANLTPIVAFTIPGRVGSDVTADDGVLVSSDNTSTLVAAVGKPGEDLTFNAYVTAKHFTMSSLSIAAVEGNVQQSLPDLTKRATTLVDGLTNVGSQRNRKLIAQLEQLRDNEKALAKQTIAVRSKAHDQAFDGYIDAYVAHTPRICPVRSATPHSFPPFSAPRPN